MALTVTTPYRKAGGRVIMRAATDPGVFLVPFTFVPSSSYTTSGDAIATADMPSGYTTLISPWALGGGPYGFKLDTTNKTLLAYESGSSGATAVQVASTTNLQTVMGTGALTIWFVCA